MKIELKKGPHGLTIDRDTDGLIEAVPGKLWCLPDDIVIEENPDNQWGDDLEIDLPALLVIGDITNDFGGIYAKGDLIVVGSVAAKRWVTVGGRLATMGSITSDRERISAAIILCGGSAWAKEGIFADDGLTVAGPGGKI